MSGINIVLLQGVFEGDTILGEFPGPLDNIFVVCWIVFAGEFPSNYWVFGVDNNKWLFVGDFARFGDCFGVCELWSGRRPLHAAGAPELPAAGAAAEERDGAGPAQGHRWPAGFQNRLLCETYSNTFWTAEHNFCCKYSWTIIDVTECKGRLRVCHILMFILFDLF